MAVMFLPISPIPPSGMIFRVWSLMVVVCPLVAVVWGGGRKPFGLRPPPPNRLEQPQALELGLDPATFDVGGLDQRQP